MDGLDNSNEAHEDDFFDEFEDEFEEEYGQDGLEEDGTEQGGEVDETVAANHEGSGGDPNSDESGSDDLDRRVEEATNQRLAEFFQRQYGGMLNPLTGQPVRTEAEFVAYQQAMAETEYNRKMAETGIDPNVLNNLIGNHPAIVAAQRMQEEQQAREAETFAKSQLGTLLSKYPDCGLTDLNQLEQSEAGRATLQDWAKTGDLVKAYTANFHEEILQRRTTAAKQGTLNQINGKKHLRQPQGSSGGGETMSPDELKTWQGFFPDKSYEEILKMWKENKE